MAADQQERFDALPPGTALQGYTVEAVLGHGGFGIVYRARHDELGNLVAIKEYLPVELAVREGASVRLRGTASREHYEDGLRRFRDEARALIEFQSHPSIVSCREFFRANGTAYLVMEYEEGLPLSELLRRREASGRPFDEADLLAVMVPLLEGLTRVHQAGALHRDIKPANVLVRRSDERPVLIDFGAAKQGVAEHSKSLAPYTEGYAALEQVGEGKLGPWTDVYAAGAVMWRIVAGGNPPWEPPNPVKVEKRATAVVRGDADPMPPARELGAGRFSPGVLAAVDRCLKLNEKDRVRGCGELLGLLRGSGAVEKAPAAAPPRAVERGAAHTAAEAVGQESVPQRRALPAAGVALAAVLGAAWFGAASWGGEDRAREAEVLARAEAAWGLAKAGREAEELRAYIEEYGGVEGAGEWVGLAESLLEELEREEHEAQEQDAVERGAQTRAEQRNREAAQRKKEAQTAWDKVKQTQSDSVLAAYVARWEGAPEAAEFVDQARIRLDDLARENREREKTARAEAQWNAVRESRDAEAARAYIEEYASVEGAGVWVRLAESLVEELGSQAKQRAAAERARLAAEAEQRRDAEAERAREAARRRKAEEELKRPGREFQDCDVCPEMVVIPAGSFLMGSPESEEGRYQDEGPQHRVTIREAFAVGVYEVTVAEYREFVSAARHYGRTDCERYVKEEDDIKYDGSWNNPGFEQTGRHPVTCANWDDAQMYVRWLSGKTGEEYRLLSEAEWEYAARAGTRMPYSFGNRITPSDANYYGGFDGKTQPVGSYSPNRFGLYDMHGNVDEWVQDCWNNSYAGAPNNGDAWERGDCSQRITRGGSWLSGIEKNVFSNIEVRLAARGDESTRNRSNYLGFRVARTLTP